MRFAIALISFVLQVSSAPQPQDTTHPAVTGQWQYDAHDSDDPRRQADRDSAGGGAAAEPRPRYGSRGGGFGGPGRMGGMGGRPGGMGEGGGGGWQARAGRGALMDLVFRAPERLDLDETDTSFTLRTGADTVILRTNGHKVERTGEANAKIELRARRRDGRLELERKVPDAGTVTETYWLSPDRTQLFVLVKLDGRRQLTFRRVYDRIEGAPRAP